MVVDTPDPEGRWPVVLRTSIQFDGDTLVTIEKRWLAAAGATELDTLAKTHEAQIAARADPIEALRRVQIATWYLAGCAASAWGTVAIVWRDDVVWLGINILATAAPLLLRLAAPRLLRVILSGGWGWLTSGFHSLDKADSKHLQRRQGGFTTGQP